MYLFYLFLKNKIKLWSFKIEINAKDTTTLIDVLLWLEKSYHDVIRLSSRLCKINEECQVRLLTADTI